jgi:uncharacterized protein YraI
MLAVPQIAEASWGHVVGASALNLRSCPSIQCARITSLPYGAPVWIDGASGGWYHVTWNGLPGFVSARFVAVTGVGPRPVYPVYPAPIVRPIAPLPYSWWGYPYPRTNFFLGFSFGNQHHHHNHH